MAIGLCPIDSTAWWQRGSVSSFMVFASTQIVMVIKAPSSSWFFAEREWVFFGSFCCCCCFLSLPGSGSRLCGVLAPRPVSVAGKQTENSSEEFAAGLSLKS